MLRDGHSRRFGTCYFLIRVSEHRQVRALGVVGDVWRCMTALREIVCGIAVVIGTVGPCSTARAGSLNSHSAGFVVANSRFGNGSIRAPIRHSLLGWQVELPGGHWTYCRTSCAETLRVETIDFFNANGAGSGALTNECGIFGCLDLKYAQ